MAKEKRLRKALVEYARCLSAEGLNVNSSGNLSVRCSFGAKHGFLITPSALAYEKMKSRDIVRMVAGEVLYEAQGGGLPSSEWELHALIYHARPEIQAVVHTHSPFATALSCLDEPIPAFHYMTAVTGGSEVLCAPYATFGSQELAQACITTLGSSRKACLMSHHGVLALGTSLDQAFSIAKEIENLSLMWMNLKQVGGCSLLNEDEMERVIEKFASYRPR